jgi:cytochrome c
MKRVEVLVAATLLACSLAAQAQDNAAGEAAVKKLGCLKCHAVSADKDGPSFRKSAEKYRSQPDQLQAFLKSGKDKHAVVKSDADLKNIVAYILSR